MLYAAALMPLSGIILLLIFSQPQIDVHLPSITVWVLWAFMGFILNTRMILNMFCRKDKL